MTPSELNGNPSKYKGAEVVMRGYVIAGPEAHVMYESEKIYRSFQKALSSSDDYDHVEYDKYCMTIANPDILPRKGAAYEAHMMTIHGKFIEKYRGENEIDIGGCNLPTAILVSRIE